jgi:hypothetical protein
MSTSRDKLRRDVAAIAEQAEGAEVWLERKIRRSGRSDRMTLNDLLTFQLHCLDLADWLLSIRYAAGLRRRPGPAKAAESMAKELRRFIDETQAVLKPRRRTRRAA